jgi:glycosyltransferase involved in cell wall biosynthesis
MPGPRSELLGAWFLANVASEVDLVHVVASQRRRSIPARLLRGAATLVGLPLVHTLPGLGMQADEDLRPLGDVTVTYSRHTADRLRAAGFPAVVTVFPPLPLERIRPIRPIHVVRQELRLGSRAILYPGHLDPGNGIREAILALSRLPPRLHDATLMVAVRWRRGQDVDAEIAALETVARRAGVAGRVRWIRHVPDMPSLVAACRMTALVPDHLDGKMDLPLVLLESLALGRPVVIADRPPMNEALLGGGRAVPFGDPAILAATFEELLGDDRTARQLAAAGRERVLALADPDRAAEAYRSVYERALTPIAEAQAL